MKPAKLTDYQYEITRRLAWGETKKEVAIYFDVSWHTIDNIVRGIFQKTGVSKINELSAWFFCTEYNISFDLSPLIRKRVAQACLALMMFIEMPGLSHSICSVRCTRRIRTEMRVYRSETLITIAA